jgi:hypothetical protein
MTISSFTTVPKNVKRPGTKILSLYIRSTILPVRNVTIIQLMELIPKAIPENISSQMPPQIPAAVPSGLPFTSE